MKRPHFHSVPATLALAASTLAKPGLHFDDSGQFDKIHAPGAR